MLKTFQRKAPIDASAAVSATPEKSAVARAFESLRHRNFLWYWISGFGSVGGQGINQFAVTWLVLDITGSVASLGLVILAQGFPMTLISLFGGVLADRYDRRFLLMAAQVVSLVSVSVLAVLTLLDLVQLWHVFANSLVLGACQALIAPSRQALIVSLVPPDERINAIALNSVQQHASRVFWPFLAGILVTFFGVGTALIANAGCYIFAVAFLMLVRNVVEEKGDRRASPLAELKDGLNYTRTTPGVSLVIGMTLIFGASSLAFIQMAPGFARAGLGFNAGETAVFMLCLGSGAIVGGTIFTMLRVTSTPRLVIGAMIGYSSTLVLFALNPWYYGYYVIAVLNGVANALEVILPNALFQTVVPSRYLGRVISLWFLAAGLAALSALPIGVIGDAYGLRFAFGCAGALFIVFGIYFGFIRKTPETPRVQYAG
jgi:MFS family permease